MPRTHEQARVYQGKKEKDHYNPSPRRGESYHEPFLERSFDETKLLSSHAQTLDDINKINFESSNQTLSNKGYLVELSPSLKK